MPIYNKPNLLYRAAEALLFILFCKCEKHLLEKKTLKREETWEEVSYDVPDVCGSPTPPLPLTPDPMEFPAVFRNTGSHTTAQAFLLEASI